MQANYIAVISYHFKTSFKTATFRQANLNFYTESAVQVTNN